MKLSESQYEVLNAIYHGASTRWEIAQFNNRRVSGICARVDELRYYLKSDGSKIDPQTFKRVEKLALNKRGEKAVQRWLVASDVVAA